MDLFFTDLSIIHKEVNPSAFSVTYFLFKLLDHSSDGEH